MGGLDVRLENCWRISKKALGDILSCCDDNLNFLVTFCYSLVENENERFCIVWNEVLAYSHCGTGDGLLFRLSNSIGNVEHVEAEYNDPCCLLNKKCLVFEIEY